MAVKHEYRAPGVYLLPQAAPPPAVGLVRTDVVGFVGYTERGPVVVEDAGLGGENPIRPEDYAVKIESWPDFLRVFGGPVAYGTLAQAVRGFFSNGGRTCYVVRVAKPVRKEMVSRDWIDPPGNTACLRLWGSSSAPVNDPRPAAVVVTIKEGRPRSAVVRDPGHFSDGTALPVVAALVAISPGAWGKRLRAELSPRRFESRQDLTAQQTMATEFSLQVWLAPDPTSFDPPREHEFYRVLDLDPGSANYAPEVLARRSSLVRMLHDGSQQTSVLVQFAVKSSDRDDPRVDAAGFGRVWSFDEVTDEVEVTDGVADVTDDDFIGGRANSERDDLRGLRLLEEIDDVAMLAIPDATYVPPPEIKAPQPPSPCEARPRTGCDPDPAPASTTPPTPRAPATPAERPGAFAEAAIDRIQSAMVSQCERLRDRVAVLDVPDGRNVARAIEWSTKPGIGSPFAALYYPWLVAPPIRQGRPVRVPPSGHVAGAIAQTDLSFGVQRPPANLLLGDVIAPTVDIDASGQEDLNPAGINAIRVLAGRGVRVFGARTLAGPTQVEWRYLHVRRLMSMIEKSVDHAMQWAVFEPHDFVLRQTIVHSLSTFLESLWRRGGFDGTRPSEGFFVRCDDAINPPASVGAGRLVCRIGVRPSPALEFLVFDLAKTPDGDTEIVEAV